MPRKSKEQRDSEYLLIEYMRILEERGCDLRSKIELIADTGDVDIRWIVIEHYEADPPERIIGAGRNVLDALSEAFWQ